MAQSASSPRRGRFENSLAIYRWDTNDQREFKSAKRMTDVWYPSLDSVAHFAGSLKILLPLTQH
jgi:hypothetical protein